LEFVDDILSLHNLTSIEDFDLYFDENFESKQYKISFPEKIFTGMGCPHTRPDTRHPCGVATISRLLKIVDLFCKRALQKRRYPAKETYDFKEPTNHSHPIQGGEDPKHALSL